MHLWFRADATKLTRPQHFPGSWWQQGQLSIMVSCESRRHQADVEGIGGPARGPPCLDAAVIISCLLFISPAQGHDLHKLCKGDAAYRAVPDQVQHAEGVMLPAGDFLGRDTGSEANDMHVGAAYSAATGC